MYKIIAFMPNGNGIGYELSKEEWESAQMETVPQEDYLQFRTTKGSVIRLNLGMYIGIEFQYDNGIVPMPPLSRPS